MSWIDDNRGQGPWDFEEQPTKWGYLNNPNWTNKPKGEADNLSATEFLDSINKDHTINSSTHAPCGHWHKGSLTITTLETWEADFWQQSIDCLKALGYYAVGAVDPTEGAYGFILAIYDFNDNLIQVHRFPQSYPVSMYTGTIRLLVAGNNIKAYYVNYVTIDEQFTRYKFFTLDFEGNYTESTIYTDSYTDSDNYVTTNFSSYYRSFAVNSSGGVVFGAEVNRKAAGIRTYNIDTYYSSDCGVTWGSVVSIVCAYYSSLSYIEIDSSGNFYAANSDSSTPKYPFRLWKSTDNGSSWVEMETIPEITSTAYYGSFDVDNTRLGFVARISDGGYVNKLYYSDNGGTSWTVRTVSTEHVSVFTTCWLAINGDTFVILCNVSNTYYIIRSDDAGVTWSEIGVVNTWDGYSPNFLSTSCLNNDEDWFVTTSCGSSVSGSDYLAFLFSNDDGESFSVEQIPVSGSSETATIIGDTTCGYDEPQVWSIE